MSSANEVFLPVSDYDLAATLDSGQVFRWQPVGNSWHGVVGKHVVCLTQTAAGIYAKTAAPVENWDWLRRFLQADTDLFAVLKTFPDDEPMRNAVTACHGLRLLRQEPWECLASFILSSTKQIVQIRQIVSHLCERFGEPCRGGDGSSLLGLEQIESKQITRGGNNFSLSPGERAGVRESVNPRISGASRHDYSIHQNGLRHSFPSPQRIATATEADLRACKMGFRAPSLLATARQIADGGFDLEKIRSMDYSTAQHELMKLRGVGGKIADCVLLFAYGFDGAFPVDVWVERALQELYFPRRRASHKRLRKFAATHFGPHAGYAQQYLFHYMRTRNP